MRPRTMWAGKIIRKGEKKKKKKVQNKEHRKGFKFVKKKTSNMKSDPFNLYCHSNQSNFFSNSKFPTNYKPKEMKRILSILDLK